MTSETTGEVDRRRELMGYGFALGAAFAYGAAQVLTRHSVRDLAPPLLGTTIALFWGTLGFLLISARSVGEPRLDLRRGSLHFAAAGLFSAMGVMLMFLALERAQVVLVAPVISTNPLFTLLLAAIFLRDIERLTVQVVVGAALVVAGVIVLTVA
jgi:drug/metabolite transporter (DMT)-like permease